MICPICGISADDWNLHEKYHRDEQEFLELFEEELDEIRGFLQVLRNRFETIDKESTRLYSYISKVEDRLLKSMGK